MTPLAVGSTAPDFALAPAPGPDTIGLSDYTGRTVVLMFVPLAFSGTCTEEFCHLRDNWDVWGGLDAAVLGVSVDSPFAVKAWADDMGVSFPILSDFNKEVVQAYGVMHEEWWGLKGVGRRSVFVIDGDGRITYAWASEDSEGLPPFAEVEAAVRATQTG